MDFSKGLLVCFDSSLEVCVALHSEIRFSQSFPNWQFTLMRSNHGARTIWHDSVARGRLPWRARFRRRYALRNADRHAMLMIGGGPAWRGTPKPSAIHLYVKDAHSTYQRALEAGATVLNELTDQPYRDRGRLRERCFRNHWYIATNRATGTAPAGLGSVTLSLHPKGGDQVMAFAEASLRRRGSIPLCFARGSHSSRAGQDRQLYVRIGEAHGQYQPMPSAIFSYVPDAAASYKRALDAGATSLWAPAQI
jgi:hypothetical protein